MAAVDLRDRGKKAWHQQKLNSQASFYSHCLYTGYFVILIIGECRKIHHLDEFILNLNLFNSGAGGRDNNLCANW